MLCIFLISIKVQSVLLEEGSQEIMPFQVHSWLLCWGLCMYYAFLIFLHGEVMLYLTVYLFDSGLRNASPPAS